ncbi:MAG: substrate-binding domain-containing protein [Chitinophagales bacterium]
MVYPDFIAYGRFFKKQNFLLFLLILQQWGCTYKKDSQPTTGADNKLHFVFITTCVDEDFFKPVRRGMNDAAALLHVDCSFIGTSGVDVPAQVNMVRKAIAAGVQGIALNIIDSTAFDDVVKDAMAKGIPVISFNSDDHATPNARMSSVCQNLYQAGLEFGKKMAPSIPYHGEVMVTVHSKGISALEERLSGIREGLKEKNARLLVTITGTNADTASQIITQTLKSNPSIRTILSTGLADTEGAGMSIRKYFHRKGYQAAGFDLSPTITALIRSGDLLFTIDQQPYIQGFFPLVQLTQYKRYGIMPSNYEIGAAFVTIKNVNEVEKLVSRGYR